MIYVINNMQEWLECQVFLFHKGFRWSFELPGDFFIRKEYHHKEDFPTAIIVKKHEKDNPTEAVIIMNGIEYERNLRLVEYSSDAERHYTNSLNEKIIYFYQTIREKKLKRILK